MHWIQSLADITLADIERVGGKAAHLGAMLRAGFPVPAGFVIDVNAFTAHFGEVTDPLVKPKSPHLQAELMADVVQALLDHLGEESELAVRSSSTQEDSHSASFAGQHSTYYFVTPNRIDQAIIDCWMSLWSNAALSYRRQGWTEVSSGEPVRMAVIVQKMLPATRSGVAFSRDPVDAYSDDCVIEATWGLGAALVDGRVTPDHIRVDESGAVKYVISDKQFKVSNHAHNHEAQRLQEISKQQRVSAVLDTEEAQHIANVSAQLETLFEAPQDVEWAYTDDQFYLLQARPITSRPQFHHIEQRLVLFKPLAENFTEPLTPLSEDLYAQVLPAIGAFYNGRCYLDFDIAQRFNILNMSEPALIDAALLRHAPEQASINWRKMLPSIGIGLLAFLADGANWIRTAQASNLALDKYRRLIVNIQAKTNYTPLQTMRRLVWGRHPFEPIGYHMLYANVSAGRYFLYIGLLRALVKKFAPDYPLAELSLTYHGAEDMQSMVLLNRIDQLSELLHDGLELKDDTAAELQSVLDGKSSTLPVQAPFTVALEAFLNDFGHRGPREMELAAPPWRETPLEFLKLLSSTPRTTKTTHGSHLAARDELHQHLKPWQRKLVNRVTDKIGHFISLRENTRHYHIMAFDTVRQKVKDVEQTLISDGKIRTLGDIFFLRHREIQDLILDQLDATSAHEIIRRRRRQWQAQARQMPLETINLPAATSAANEADLSGQGASPGIVEAQARVIHSLAEADQLKVGEILVAPYTDPAWTPLFSKAAGIVVGTGSFLSHAGTVARELHVPCVVDVKSCMTHITNGDLLRVDATAGTVEILS